MPALTITAVDTANDKLTCVGHGLVTGDGESVIYAASGTLPTGLAALTPYWIIRVDADNFKLATSSANALLGTAIDITAAGTAAGAGTLQLLIGLPYRRAHTYVPRAVDVAGSKIRSGDLNSLEDVDVALWNLLTGQAQSIFTAIKFAVPVTFAGGITNTNTVQVAASDWKAEAAGVTYSFANAKWTWTGFDDITTGIRPIVGKRLTGARFCFNRTAGTLNFSIQKRAAGAGAWANVVTGSDNATAGAGVKVLACTEVVAADTQYRLYVDSSGVATFDVASFDYDQ
jgi:hypothetical protein